MVPTTTTSSEVTVNCVVEESTTTGNIAVSLPDNAAVESSQQHHSHQPHAHHHHNHRGHNGHHHHNHSHNHGHHHHPAAAGNGHHHHANGNNGAIVHPMMHPHAHPHSQPHHHHPHHQMVMPPMPHHPNNYNYLASQYTSLYVGDLAPDVNEIMLSELFSKVGRSAVASIHVCRDSITFRSLGYAYVNFFNSIDAERALDTLNYSQIMGRPCRIMWSLRDPTKRKSNVGNIFVKNLDKQVDNAMLFDTFSKFGNILSCKIEYEKGVSKGYGYVHFETQESSDRAIQGVNGTMLCGKPITVEQFVSKVERFKEKNEHKLFIKNIDELATVEQLQAELSRFGEIESCIIRLDNNGKSKGLGFVEFKSVEDAQRLMDNPEPIQILSKPITIDRIKNKMERNIEHRQIKQQQANGNPNNNNNVVNNSTAPTVAATTTTTTTTVDSNGNPTNSSNNNNSVAPTNLTLFIHNIDESIDKEVIREEFAKHGTILGIKIVQENGKNRGFGFLSYSTQEEANIAIEKMNGFILGSKPLSVSFSNRKYKKRMQQLQSNGSNDPSQPQPQPHIPLQPMPYYFRNPYHHHHPHPHSPHHQGQVFHPHQQPPYYTHQMPPNGTTNVVQPTL
ncbi:RNA-binding region RNP-1 domain-containing protein [Heterostelium album PN500]|uniref:RNA-binding region RNP-1 domain-containing protein n=1 Tax=Heterostelium pallidum (strain ATCC 26659 / Pp 5 / PN500) TaxID=670386 RepID=D3BK30_HETP5|nr:RNA-binding region RNP-1 domain-containing protein [Heterostelium album PN500]EFA78260.1 RNA-binding region RNP-1 domain-containing protein [Heterostelium album PN500]|eukprot:XP_020430385.1 RNA-binding region RNP-1 domain-containing protein [Heterostelium album PN500]